jgi:hypothetical protein
MSIPSLYVCLVLLLAKSNLRTGVFSARNDLIYLAVCLAVMPLATTENWYLYFGLILLSLSFHWAANGALAKKELSRVVCTCAVVGLSLLSINSSYFDDRLPDATMGLIYSALAAFPALNGAGADDARAFLTILLGFDIVAFESNYVVLLIINEIPRVATSATAEALIVDKNKGMGRIIGILERGIVFVLVISSNASLIGFIIAVKALARFKELEKKDFAEYFIIGTMSSLLITISLSLVDKRIIA